MKHTLDAGHPGLGYVRIWGICLALAGSLNAASEPASPAQAAAAARLEEAETIAQLTRLRGDLADCRSQALTPENSPPSAAAAVCPDASDSSINLVPLAVCTALGFGAGFVCGAWWLDSRQRRRHGGFRL